VSGWVGAQTNDSVVSGTTSLTIAERKAELLNKKLAAQNDAGQARFDTIDNRKPKLKEQKEQYIFIPDPNKSMWYALICPGLGQIYNRRYWKVPIVYGGFAGLIYGISWSGKNYNLYRREYTASQKGNRTTLFHLSDTELKNRMDASRRSRDLCIIGTVAFYGITVLDAFVDAALADFDISPDLSMKIKPTIIQNPKNMALAMQININF